MKRMRRVLLVLAVTGLVINLAAEEKPLASERLVKALKNEVSGEIAFRYTVRLSHHDRIQASEGWHDAAVLIRDELKTIGIDDVEIEGWPSNGSRYYYTYQTPIGWRARSAELWLVSPIPEKLCSYEEIPLTLVKHSNAAEVEAGLIDVGTGLGDQSYSGKDVQGKIVLATAYTGDVMREAVVKRGALGVITWYPPEVRPGYPNMIRYTAIWPRWEERDRIGFGFNVSKNQGWRLKKMLDEGQKLVLKASVDAEYYDSRIEVLSAVFPGTVEPEKEIMIIGHLCHPSPSANDNASGSGGMLEMARALKRMIDQGLVSPPKRTIRFLWVPEFYGTVPYIKAHLERTRNTLAVINCDMIGEDLHLTGGTFNITCTPDSLPSYLNDVVVNYARLAQRLDLTSMNGSRHPFVVRVRPFSGGSDHYVFNDGALKVPAVMFGHGDTFHHTSLDTPDKVDPSELRRICFTTLGAACHLADAGNREALEMARLIARNGIGRIAEDYYDSLNSLLEAGSPEELHAAYLQVENVLAHSIPREESAISSVGVFVDNREVLIEIDSISKFVTDLFSHYLQDLKRIYQKACLDLGTNPVDSGKTEEERKMDSITPVRNSDFVCPLQTSYIEDKLGPEALDGLKITGNVAYEALNFADGKRTITDIARAVSAEYGPVPVRDVFDFFKLLERAGLVEMKHD